MIIDKNNSGAHSGDYMWEFCPTDSTSVAK